ncbi:hypothetical protein T439DRAFT_351203 [Meredithblackwellia eburnea MCA 4105]
MAAPIPNLNKTFTKRRGVAQLDPGDIITCAKGKTLVTHDCNVAFLALGPGGIAGAIQFLRPNSNVATGVSGTCKFTATAINGGGVIDASKGRLEHGQEPMIAQCGATVGSKVTIVGGSVEGDVELVISEP